MTLGAETAARGMLDGHPAGSRVVFVNWRDPWQKAAGGAELYAWQMCRELCRRGAEVTLLTSREAGQAREERRDGIRIVRYGGIYSRYPLLFGWLARHRDSFDVAIDCMNGIPFFSPLALSPRTKILLLVHHVHSAQFGVYFGPLLATFGRFLEGPVARRVYRGRPAVAVSRSTVVSLRRELRWSGPVHIVPNGAPEPGEPPADVVRGGEPSLVWVGRLVAHKRVDELVLIVARLRERWPGVRLHIVGRGEQEQALREQITRLGLDGNVTLHGYLSEADKRRVLGGADLHVSASRYEGWGLSVIEAAALGVPTVSYDVNGLRDAIRDGETGWLAVPGEDLADTVARALKDLQARRPELAAACRSWAARFTWQASGELLTQVIRGGRAVPGDLDEG
ncbi:glycosyltransferase family 4 protein [Actinocorallia lasiicapitis]